VAEAHDLLLLPRDALVRAAHSARALALPALLRHEPGGGPLPEAAGGDPVSAALNEQEYVAFTVHGEAVTQGNLRRGPRGGLYEPNPNLQVWRQRIAQTAGVAMGGRPVFDGALRLRLRFLLVRPDGHYNTKGEHNAEGRRHPYPEKRPDLDKLTRAVLDACKGVVFSDDARVVQLEVSKEWGLSARLEAEVEPARPFVPTSRSLR
jgi:Holliday junction resolvase RusA-like endonuclease